MAKHSKSSAGGRYSTGASRYTGGATLPGRKSENVTQITKAKTLPTNCWCEKEVVNVPPELVRKGSTLSCGRSDCHA